MRGHDRINRYFVELNMGEGFKYLFFLSFLAVVIPAKGQSLNISEPDFKGNIKSVVEKSVKYPDSWREFEFDNQYRQKEKKYFREHNWVQSEKWDYIESDSLLIIKREIDNGTRIEHFIDKFYFDSDKRIKRQEIFSHRDTIYPMIIFTNFVFSGTDILQYNRILINNKDTTTVELYEKIYSKDKLTVIVKKTDSKGISSFIRTLKYDKKGNLKSQIVDYNNPEVVLAGVRTWSRWRHDKYRIDYKYDDQGNWLESYAVTWRKKYKTNIRLIEYE